MPTSNHVPQGQLVDYNSIPPASGDHWGVWAACGFYEDGLPDELITHNLEHGNIVVSYNLSSRRQIEQLRRDMADIDLASDWGVTRYYSEIPEGSVAMAAWGRLYTLSPDNTEAMAGFFSSFAGELGPERIPC